MSDTLSYLGDETGRDSSRGSPLALVVVRSPDPAVVGTRHVLHQTQLLVIGREVTQGLRVQDARLSKLHLRVLSSSREASFADAGSSNGTFVNGQAALEGSLALGDVLRVGDTLLVVSDDSMASLQSHAAQAARSNLPVLILGETGSGKELLARSIHEQSGRSGSFIPVNCATLPRELAAAELFGHARGAFSGAGSAREGLFRAAESGTLFLDEIGDLPLELQPALLRALQEQKVRPLGTDREVSVDARVLAATHVDLEQAVEMRAFRADLLGRLAHVVLRLPPLRSRRAELLELAQKFCQGVGFSPNAAEALLIWGWPRNIRELKAVVEAAALRVEGRSQIRLSDIQDRVPEAAALVRRRRASSTAPPGAPPRMATDAPELLQTAPGSATASGAELSSSSRRAELQAELAAAERELILRALDETETQADAARKLGISRRTLINRLEAYGIARPRKSKAPEGE